MMKKLFKENSQIKVLWKQPADYFRSVEDIDSDSRFGNMKFSVRRDSKNGNVFFITWSTIKS